MLIKILKRNIITILTKNIETVIDPKLFLINTNTLKQKIFSLRHSVALNMHTNLHQHLLLRLIDYYCCSKTHAQYSSRDNICSYSFEI